MHPETRQTARPVTRRKAKQVRSILTTDAILIAAAEVLEDSGYSRTTTDRIAERAGVSVGSIYQYFGNKRDLFERVFDRQSDLIIAGLRSFKFDENAPASENLQRVLDIAKGTMTPGQIRELRRIPELKARIASVSEMVVSSIADIVGHLHPQLPEKERRIKAELVAASSYGLGLTSRDKKHNAELAKEFDLMINLYIAG